MKRPLVMLAVGLFMVVCNNPVNNNPVNNNPENSAFTDSRDGKKYRTIKIGTQTWFAENLNYAGSGGDIGACYDNNPNNCVKYGRLYNWSEAMGCNFADDSCDYTEQGICPEGWHIPSREEWIMLINFVGGASIAGTKLKARKGWNSYEGEDGNGTDEFSFSAIPAGTKRFNFLQNYEEFHNIDYISVWYGEPMGLFIAAAYTQGILFESLRDYSDFFSLRCIKN